MKLFIKGVLISLIAGCSSTTVIQNDFGVIVQSLQKKNIGEIRIIREDSLLQKYATLDVFIGGLKKASLKNASAQTIKVQPGTHRLEVKMAAFDAKSGCGADLDISSGEVVYIEASPSGGGAALPIVSIITNPMVCKFNLVALPQNTGIKQYEKHNKPINAD